MWLMVLSALAIPVGAAVFFVFDRWVFRDDADSPQSSTAELTTLHISGR
jgi:uncharacterized membrane protein YdjX (TVP38/TMEM64 family)